MNQRSKKIFLFFFSTVSVYSNQPKAQQHEEAQKLPFDPQTVNALVYRAEIYILTKYPYLIDINTKNDNIHNNLNENNQYFVIKCFSEEDIHKAIKYQVWTSTKNGNQTLENSFNQAKSKGGDVFLFFSCNGSGRFAALGKMKTNVDYNKVFPFWSQDNKWGGLFEVEWILIKDVPFKKLKDIVITLNDGLRKPITNSRDCQELPPTESALMMEIFAKYPNSNTILEHFEYYDVRQDNYEKNNPHLKEQLTN